MWHGYGARHEVTTQLLADFTNKMELLWNIKSRANFDNKYEKCVEIYGAAGTISIGLTTKETLDKVF